MPKATSHIPPGLTAVTPTLVAKDARALVDFAVKVFGAKAGHMMPGPDGKGIMHGMFHIEGDTVFIADASEMAKPTTANMFVYVPDVDAAWAAAVAAGATPRMPVADMFWGDRMGSVVDAWGNLWNIATHQETITAEEMKERMQKSMKR